MIYTIKSHAAIPPPAWEWRSGRITRAAYKYHVDTDGPVIVVGAWLGEELLGVAAVGIGAEGWDYAIVVVHPEYRRQGIGTALLSARLAIQEKQRPEWPRIAQVAYDNPASLRMCEKAGCVKVGERLATRNSGPYTAYLMEAK